MFRYRDFSGREQVVVNETALDAAIRAGDIHAGTPLAEGSDGRWGVAGRHPAFARALKKMGSLARLRSAYRRRRGVALFTHPRRVAAGALAIVVLVAGGFTASHLRERALAEQRLAYAEAMLGFASGRQPAPDLIAAAVGAPIADDPVLRTLWVRFQVARTIARSADSAQATFAVRGFLPPDGWMTDDYVRSPRAFPEIGRHWAAYLAWDRAWAKGAEDLLFNENARRAAEAGLTERETFELIDPEQPGLSAVGWDLELRRQFAAEAARLHTTLVESRGNAFLDEGKWWFADTRTQRAYAVHRHSLQRIGEQLRANAAKRAAALGIEPGTGVVPATLGSMRPAGDLPSAR